jgi:hypothetical protein
MDEAARIRCEFARRQSTQRRIQILGIAMGLVALLAGTTCGATRKLLMWACIPTLVGLLGWTVKNWKCPRCGRLLGKKIDIRRCPYCKAEYS